MSRYELREALMYTNDNEYKNAAGEELINMQPYDYELSYIIRFCSNADLKNRAWVMLCERKHVTTIDEKGLIKKIAEKVLANTDLLDMNYWHCKTSHCLAGWACILDETAKLIELRMRLARAGSESTGTAASIVLPNYAYLFNSDNETVLAVLRAAISSH